MMIIAIHIRQFLFI